MYDVATLELSGPGSTNRSTSQPASVPLFFNQNLLLYNAQMLVRGCGRCMSRKSRILRKLRRSVQASNDKVVLWLSDSDIWNAPTRRSGSGQHVVQAKREKRNGFDRLSTSKGILGDFPRVAS